jgi:hypothetical protein
MDRQGLDRPRRRQLPLWGRGSGQTLLAQQLACSVSIGAPWLGLPTAQGSVLAILCEDERDELWRRHNDIKAALGYAIGNPFHEVWLWPRVGEDNVLIRWDRDGKATLGPLAQQIVEAIERHEPSVLILDTLADFYGGNEIDRPQVNYFVKTVLGGMIKARAGAGLPQHPVARPPFCQRLRGGRPRLFRLDGVEQRRALTDVPDAPGGGRQ